PWPGSANQGPITSAAAGPAALPQSPDQFCAICRRDPGSAGSHGCVLRLTRAVSFAGKGRVLERAWKWRFQLQTMPGKTILDAYAYLGAKKERPQAVSRLGVNRADSARRMREAVKAFSTAPSITVALLPFSINASTIAVRRWGTSPG